MKGEGKVRSSAAYPAIHPKKEGTDRAVGLFAYNARAFAREKGEEKKKLETYREKGFAL